jgi:hypothetical protein
MTVGGTQHGRHRAAPPQCRHGQYVAPQYVAPQYVAPQYVAPQYIAPQYIAPQYIARAGRRGPGFP